MPTLPDADAIVLSVGIIGATVMPHALYLHSSLTQNRMPAASPAERRAVLRFSNIEVVVALGVAGLVNMAMVAMAAAAFHQGHAEVAEIEAAYHTLVPLLGGGAALVFALSLLASGFSSSIVGTMAGQSIMQDFVHFRIPVWLRRAVTMAPAFVLVGLGANVTAVAGLEPGGAEPGAAGADAGAGGADRRPAGDGRLRQRTAHPGRGDAGGGGGAGAEPGVDRTGIRGDAAVLPVRGSGPAACCHIMPLRRGRRGAMGQSVAMKTRGPIGLILALGLLGWAGSAGAQEQTVNPYTTPQPAPPVGVPQLFTPPVSAPGFEPAPVPSHPPAQPAAVTPGQPGATPATPAPGSMTLRMGGSITSYGGAFSDSGRGGR